ncbi:MAG: TIGR04282 family arsenosugar biosynthesis glycosyltransferase [Halioglobus sp.]|nr:TIGR04282 family arsenosugar biosynthesis glycosyltransferase [Halioglobus sp.]
MGAESPDCLFIQFAREPVAGAVKTRMIPYLSPREACALHSELVLWTAATLVAARLGRVELAVAGAVGHSLFQDCLGLGVASLTLQRGADLGARMYNALVAGLDRFERVVLVGSDCPSIDRDYLNQALAALYQDDIVLGPAADGGYTLVGARRVPREMFEGISWGTAAVYAETTLRLQRSGVAWSALPVLNDIDRPGDLPAWMALRATRGG